LSISLGMLQRTMAGWYVKQIILQASDIKSCISEIKGVAFDELDDLTPFEVMDFDDDTYDDLLSIEMTLNSLLIEDKISAFHYQIIKKLMEGYIITDVAGLLNTSRVTVYTALNSVSSMIEEKLGGHFSDSNFKNSFIKKYNLDEKEIGKLNEYIK